MLNLTDLQPFVWLVSGRHFPVVGCVGFLGFDRLQLGIDVRMWVSCAWLITNISHQPPYGQDYL